MIKLSGVYSLNSTKLREKKTNIFTTSLIACSSSYFLFIHHWKLIVIQIHYLSFSSRVFCFLHLKSFPIHKTERIKKIVVNFNWLANESRFENWSLETTTNGLPVSIMHVVVGEMKQWVQLNIIRQVRADWKQKKINKIKRKTKSDEFSSTNRLRLNDNVNVDLTDGVNIWFFLFAASINSHLFCLYSCDWRTATCSMVTGQYIGRD